MLTIIKYIYAAAQHNVCHVPRETIERVALFHVKQLVMLHRTMSQRHAALQHNAMLQCS